MNSDILLRLMYLACFVVSTYVILIRICWTLILCSILQKTISSCELKEERPHAGLYNHNGRSIEFVHMIFFICGQINKA